MVYKSKSYKSEKFNLTKKQKKILTYLVEGLTEKSIASKINLCQSTIKYHKNAQIGCI